MDPVALQQISRTGDVTAARRKIDQELLQIGIDTLNQADMKAKQTQGDIATLAHLLASAAWPGRSSATTAILA